jgi:hypothetical protein
VALWIRYLGVVGLAFWLGGVTFYGAVVVPTAHQVLDSHREIGFVTRAVTGTANAVGLATLALLVVNTAVSFRPTSRSVRITLVGSLVLMAIAQAALFILRRVLDGMLDPVAMTMTDRGRFMPLHERYLNVTSVLCLAGLVHLWAMLVPPAKRPT